MASFKIIIQIIIVLLVFIGCSSDSSDTTSEKNANSTELKKNVLFAEYPFKEDLNYYLNDLFVQPQLYDTIFFIPLNTCELCVVHTLESLDRNNFSGLLVLGGKEGAHPNFDKIINKIDNSATVVRDSTYEMLQYNIDIFGPTLILDIEESKMKYIHIEYKMLPVLLDSLGWD